MTEQSDGDSPECAHCNEPVAASGSGQRVHTSVEDGAVEYVRFCSADCLEAWRDRSD